MDLPDANTVLNSQAKQSKIIASEEYREAYPTASIQMNVVI